MLDTAVNPAKTAEPIDVLFGVWTWVGPRNHMLDGTQIPPPVEGAVGGGIDVTITVAGLFDWKKSNIVFFCFVS